MGPLFARRSQVGTLCNARHASQPQNLLDAIVRTRVRSMTAPTAATCPKCQSPLVPGVNFCGNCGALISGVWGSRTEMFGSTVAVQVTDSANTIAELLTNSESRRQLLAHRGDVLSRYDWDQAAAATLSVLEEAVGAR